VRNKHYLTCTDLYNSWVIGVLDSTELCDRFWYLLWDGLQSHDVYENRSFGSEVFFYLRHVNAAYDSKTGQFAKWDWVFETSKMDATDSELGFVKCTSVIMY
jgi:hypothetical protein